MVAVLLVATTTATEAQGSRSTERARLGALPIVGSAPETGFQYGVTLFRVYRAGADTSTRPSVDQFLVSNTAKNQLKASFQTERWMDANAWRLRGRVEYQDFPLPFFGIGPATPAGDEEWYGARGPAIHLQAHRRLRPATYIMGGYRLGHTRIGDVEPVGILARRTVTGSDGSTISQVQGGMIRDSRDNIFSPSRGTFAQAVISVSTSALGADHDFTRLDADARRYVRLGRVVLAGQVQYARGGGTMPFDQLPAIGADTALRGYTRGRFRDRNLLSAQVELRTPSWGRVGFTAFAGAGAVAARASELAQVQWQPSVGAGARFVLFQRERTSIRVDYARGRGSSGLYIGLNEAY